MTFLLIIFLLLKFVHGEEEDYEGESFVGKFYHENKPDSLIIIDPASEAQEALESTKDGNFEKALSARTCIMACPMEQKCQEITYVADTFVYPTRGDFLNAVDKMDYCRSNTRTKYFGPPTFNWIPQDTTKKTTEHDNLKLGEIRCGKCKWCNSNWVITDLFAGKGYWSYWDRETIGDRAVRLFRQASLHYYDDPVSFISAWNLVASYGNIYQILPASKTCESYGFNSIPAQDCNPYDFNDYNEPFEWFLNVSPRDDTLVKCGRKYYDIVDVNRVTGYISLSTRTKSDFDFFGDNIQICRTSAEDIPSLLPYEKSWENRIALGTIVNAQVAAIAWAKAQCNSYEHGSCLLGIHDNSRDHKFSTSIPVLSLVSVDLAMFDFQKDGYNLVIRKNAAFLKETQETAKMISMGITVGFQLNKATNGFKGGSNGFGQLKNAFKHRSKKGFKAAARKQFKDFFKESIKKVNQTIETAKKIKDFAKSHNRKQATADVKKFLKQHKKQIKNYVAEKAADKGEEFLNTSKEEALEAASDLGNAVVDEWVGEVFGEDAIEDRYLIQNDYEQLKVLRSDDDKERDEARGALKEWLAGELTEAIMQPISVEYWFEFGSCVGRCDTVGTYDWIGVSASISAFDSMDASASYYNIVQSSFVANTGNEGFDDAMNLVFSLNPVTRILSSVVQGLMSGTWTRHLFAAEANLAIPNPVAFADMTAEDDDGNPNTFAEMSLKLEAGTSRSIESDSSLSVTNVDIESAEEMLLLRQNNTRRNIMQPYVTPFEGSALEIFKSAGPEDRMGAVNNYVECPYGSHLSYINPYQCFHCPMNTIFETSYCAEFEHPDLEEAPMPVIMSEFFEPAIVNGVIRTARKKSPYLDLEQDVPIEVSSKSIFRASSLRNHIAGIRKPRNITRETPHIHGSSINSPAHIRHKVLVSFNWLDLTEDNKIIIPEDVNFHRVQVKTCEFYGQTTIELHRAYKYKNSQFIARLLEYLRDMDNTLLHTNFMDKLMTRQCGEQYEPAYIPAGISYHENLIKYNDKWQSKINDNSNNPNRRFGLFPVREPECSYRWSCICGPGSSFRYSTYGEIKNTELEHNEFLVPVTSLPECKAALRFWGESGLKQYDVERRWASKLPLDDVEKLPVYASNSNIYGCFKKGNSFSFNTNINPSSNALDCKHDQNVVRIVTFNMREKNYKKVNVTDHVYLVDNGKIKHRMLSRGTEIGGDYFTGSITYIPENETNIRSYRTLDKDSHYVDHDTTVRLINDKLFVIHHKSGEFDSPFVLQTEKSLLRFYMERSRHKGTGLPMIRKYMSAIAENDMPALQHTGDLFTPGMPDENGNLKKYMIVYDQIRSFDTPSTQFDHLVQVPSYDLFTSDKEKYATARNLFMKKISCMNKLGDSDATVYITSNSAKTGTHMTNGVCDEGYVGKHCDVPTMSVYESLDIQLPNITGQLVGGYCGDVYNHVPPNAQTCENRATYASRHCKEGMGMITHTHLDEDPIDWTDTNDIPNTYLHYGKIYHQCVVCPLGTTSPEGDYICRPQDTPHCNKGYFDANPDKESCNYRCMPGWYGKDCTIQLFKSTLRVSSHYSSFADQYNDVIDNIPHPETNDWGDYAGRGDRVPTLHTIGGIQYADNEILSQPKFLTCNDGFVPSRLTEHELEINMRQTPVAFTSELQRISARHANTCGGYVCKRCPDTYYEKNQVCVPCPSLRQVAGWALGETGDLSNKCMISPVPKGHFYDPLKPDCKHNPFIREDMIKTALAGSDMYDGYILKDLYENATVDAVLNHLCKQTAWAGVCLHDDEILNQTECEISAVDTAKYPTKYITSCKDWVHHPVGGIGGYQASVNQTYCDIAQEGRRHKIMGRTVFNNGLPGSKPNADWTSMDQCEDYEICNGQEVVGCQPGYIWFKDTLDVEDSECQICNNDSTVTDMHAEKEPYEYCDGSPYFKCAQYATHTDADPSTFGTDAQGVSDYIGSRSTWNGSKTERFEVNYANFEVPKINKYTQPFPDYYKKIREYDIGHDPLNRGKGCYPTPDGFYTAVGDNWQKQPCEEDIKHMCVHRTSHKPLTGMPSTTRVMKYPNSNAVLFQSFDAINRFDPDVICLPGLLPNGCRKEKCVRTGQSNCWCGDEDFFCTMGCVNSQCRATCGNEMCNPDSEVCYGFNDMSAGISYASCERLCTSPVSNFCVIVIDGIYKYCRHYNENYDKPPLSFNGYDSPCLNEVPNVAETQCVSPTEQGCFCGREFISPGDSTHWGCFQRNLEPKCNILQDDGTCTYIDSPHGKCICGESLSSDTCYANRESKCGVYGTTIPSCTRRIQESLEGSCRATRSNNPLPEHDATTVARYSLENECDTYISESECNRVAEIYDIPFLTDSNRMYSEGCSYKDGIVFYNTFSSNYISQDVTVTCPFGSYTPGIGGSSDWHKAQPTNAQWRENECKEVFERFELPFKGTTTISVGNLSRSTGYRYDGCQEDGTVIQFNMNDRRAGLGTRMCVFSSPYILPDDEFNTGYKSICPAHIYTFENAHLCAHKDSSIDISMKYFNISEVPQQIANCVCENCTDARGLYGCMDRSATNFDMYASVPAKCVY